jgi:hypothetical protein
MSNGAFSHRDRASQPDSTTEVLAEEYVAKSCPKLAVFLTEVIESLGRDKKNTLTLFWDAGRWKFSLSDKSADLKTFSTLETLEDFLEAVEAHYTDPHSEWRKDRSWKR